jgi:hypothetical protein
LDDVMALQEEAMKVLADTVFGFYSVEVSISILQDEESSAKMYSWERS